MSRGSGVTARPSTSWGGKSRARSGGTGRPSTSWGARSRAHRLPAIARLTAAVVGLATVVVPLSAGTALAAGARHPVVVAGPGAAAAVHAVGGHDVRTAGYAGLAVTNLTTAQARELSAHGLRVAPDVPVRLDSAGDGTDNTHDGDASTTVVRP